MTDKKVWLITGASRGSGAEIAKAALGAGHALIATGRDAVKVGRALGPHEDSLNAAGFLNRAEIGARNGRDRSRRRDRDHPSPEIPARRR